MTWGDLMEKSYIFNNDERIIINQVFAGAEFAKVTKDFLLSHLEFMLEATSDDEMKALLEGLIDKVHGLSDMEWDDLKLVIPLDTDYALEVLVD